MTTIEEDSDFGITDFNFKVIIDYDEFKRKYEIIVAKILNVVNEIETEQCTNDIENLTLTQHNEYDEMVERNEQLLKTINDKLEDVSVKQQQYETLKQDKMLLAKALKEKHEAFLMANKYFKKFLNIYYTVNSSNKGKQIIDINFFTEFKKDHYIYSIRFLRDPNTKTLELLNTNPQFQNIKELQNILKVHDFPGLLCYVRKAFLDIKEKKI